MTRTCLLSAPPLLALLTACPPWPDLVTCEEAGACETTGPATTGDDGPPTTSDGVQTVTGDSTSPDASSGSTAPAAETGDESSGTTDQPVLPPQIVDGVVIPDYIDDNGLLSVEVSAVLTEGVTMLLDDGQSIELTPIRPGQFAGTISAFTALDNGKHKAVLTPWRAMLVGDSLEADYVIALPPPGYETGWTVDGIEGNVAAIAVLPDGRPVEFGTFQEMGAPRCYLRLRDKQGQPLEKLVPVLASAYCRAIDLKIDRDTGRLNVLVERQNNVDDTVWWAGEMSAWGKSLKNIGIGAVGDTALALAARPDVVAVCGTRAVNAPAIDKLDALAVLLRPGELPEPRVFDYVPPGALSHTFAETAHDCDFSQDTLVLVGAANGRHDEDQPKLRDRLMVIESDLAVADDAAWTVAGLDQGVQTRALALDLDEQGRYLLAGYTCFDTCEPVGEVRVYAPGGKLAAPTLSLGPLGSAWFGPHDIAWSPAGYAVVALGGQDEQTVVFKVQAVAPGVALPLWTFIPNDKKGPQIALAVAVGPYGEVYAGGIGAGDQAAFARIGS